MIGEETDTWPCEVLLESSRKVITSVIWYGGIVFAFKKGDNPEPG